MKSVGLDQISPYLIFNLENYKYAFLRVDNFSKLVDFILLRKVFREQSPMLFFDNFVSQYGVSVKLVRDHDPCFASDIFKVLSSKSEIFLFFTAPYQLQSNMAERVNRNLIHIISSYIGLYHKKWETFFVALCLYSS